MLLAYLDADTSGYLWGSPYHRKSDFKAQSASDTSKVTGLRLSHEQGAKRNCAGLLEGIKVLDLCVHVHVWIGMEFVE